MKQGMSLTTEHRQHMQYPVRGIAAALFLIFLTPFVSSVLSYAAFVICLCRVVKYDARVFAVDYCLLVPLNTLFRAPGGVTFVLILGFVAAIWYFIKRGIRKEWSYVFLILLLNYLILRSELNINKFALCFGQLFTLGVLVSEQNEESAVCAAKAFCISVLISSVYGLALRNTPQLRAILGAESQAIWGTGIIRFCGLLADPNYYMTMPVTCLALLVKLKECNRIGIVPFVFMSVSMMVLGALSYSKTFILVLAVFVILMILWQFLKGNRRFGIISTLAVVLIGGVLLAFESSPFAVIVERLKSADSIRGFTTGRSTIYLYYIREIFSSPQRFLFGAGLAATQSKEAHNIFIEITHYFGVVGLALFACFFISLGRMIKRKTPGFESQDLISKYTVLVMVLLVYCTLHGVFSVIAHTEIFLVYLSFMITRDMEVDRPCQRMKR